MHLTEIVVHKRHHVNMGNFENVEAEFTANFELDVNDNADDCARTALEFVDEQLRPDLERAARTTAEAETYVDTWLDGPQRRGTRKVSRTR